MKRQVFIRSERVLGLTVMVTALGYFIDMFDLLIFNMVRMESLGDLGLSGQEITEAGLFVSNAQFGGFILGAWISGVLGDKFGRKRTLYFSILVYSAGSLACAFVQDVPSYALARFITGLGLAGELGAGISLISERLDHTRRGTGVMVLIGMGFLGVVAAALVSEFLPWRTVYIVGGVLGLALLVTRSLLSESMMFENAAAQDVPRGGLRLIIRDPELLRRWVCAIAIMVPAVFVPQILWTLSPEIAAAMGVQGEIRPHAVLAIGYGSVIVGDFLAMALSEWLRSRKKASLVFLALGSLVFLKYAFFPAHTVAGFYIWNGLLGLSFGVWVIGAAWAAEQFGTNIRATASATIPNFARGLTIPMNLAYGALKGSGSVTAACVIGGAVFLLAWIGWRGLPETWGKDLDYCEPP